MRILTLTKAVGALLASVGIAFCVGQVSASKEAPTTTTVAVTTAAPTTTQPPAPTTTLPDLSGVDFTALARSIHGRCGEWYDTAMAVGWPDELWPTLSYVMYRESRCNPDSYNGTDPNSGSRGLVQINGFWCRPWAHSEKGWLQERDLLTTCDDLYNPGVNLGSAWAMWRYSQEHNGCGWRPWATSCKKKYELVFD